MDLDWLKAVENGWVEPSWGELASLAKAFGVLMVHLRDSSNPSGRLDASACI